MIIIQINFLCNISSTQIAWAQSSSQHSWKSPHFLSLLELQMSLVEKSKCRLFHFTYSSIRFEGGDFGRKNSLCYAQNQPNHPKADWLFLSDKMPSRKNQTRKEKTISPKDFLRLSFLLFCLRSTLFPSLMHSIWKRVWPAQSSNVELMMRLSGGKSDLMMIAKNLHSLSLSPLLCALNARNAIKPIPPQLDRRKLINFNLCAALLSAIFFSIFFFLESIFDLQ